MKVVKEGFANKVNSLVNKVKYYTGKSKSKYDFSNKAYPEDLRKTDWSLVMDKIKPTGIPGLDRDSGAVRVQIKTSNVPKDIVSYFKPDGELYKYITDYDPKSAVATLEIPASKGSGDKESMMTPVQVPEDQKSLQCNEEGELVLKESSDDMDYDFNNKDSYVKLAKKYVKDSDGFNTEYTLYRNADTGTYVCIFGDTDLYSPNDTEPDAEFDTEEEAKEWFYDYKGFEDEDEEDSYEESLELKDEVKEDYWFGGDGKIDEPETPAKPFSGDSEETLDLNIDNKTKDEEDNEGEDLEEATNPSSIGHHKRDSVDLIEDGKEAMELKETPGLKLSTPKVTHDDFDGFLEIEINGKTYKYKLNQNSSVDTIDEMAEKVKKMQTFSDGKALAYLKKNMHLVTESKELEANYGGAYDMDPERYFSREDLDEFAQAVADEVNEQINPEWTYEVTGIESPSDKVLEIILEDPNEGAQMTAHINIDMRKISRPHSIYRYMDDAVNQILSDIHDYHNDLEESLELRDINEVYVPDMTNKVEHKMSIDDYLDHCTAHGGNWTAMLMSGIKEVFPKYWEKMEDRTYEYSEILEILRNLGVYWEGSDSEVKESFSKGDLTKLTEDTEIVPGQELTSKSGHKIKILGVTPYYSEYKGDPYIKIKYSYETTDGRSGEDECNTWDLFNMLKESKEVVKEKFSFKDSYICKGCGKPLSQCTCEVNEDE